ncbi:hypothetical protein L1987_48028 [Smallanthus sonchifolius]|uniref:Uncharacterized protein n=1 Tax=Smallanthus sonchifolius TaxID=185202 RepID=A0ACB9FQ71_9ASTR|nr:hypothetical protein L1987_48028 [Smallanthus sonchifolius]
MNTLRRKNGFCSSARNPPEPEIARKRKWFLASSSGLLCTVKQVEMGGQFKSQFSPIKSQLLDSINVLSFESYILSLNLLICRLDEIQPGSNLLQSVEYLVSGPIDNQSLLDFGILCCLVYILNALLGTDEKVTSAEDEPEVMQRKRLKPQLLFKLQDSRLCLWVGKVFNWVFQNTGSSLLSVESQDCV